MTSKIQCIGRYRQTRTIIESLRGNTYVGCRKLPRDPLAGRGLVSLNFTNTHKGERLEGNLRVKLDKNLGLLSRPLIPIRLLNVIIRNNNDCLWCRGHRVQETSKVTPRLNLLTNVRRTGNRITHDQDCFPFGVHATDIRDYTIFAIFNYLRRHGLRTRRRNDSRDRAGNQRSFLGRHRHSLSHMQGWSRINQSKVIKVAGRREMLNQVYLSMHKFSR